VTAQIQLLLLLLLSTSMEGGAISGGRGCWSCDVLVVLELLPNAGKALGKAW
jgi:hypothetical protein